MFEDINIHRQAVAQNLVDSFEKARYVDNAENRKLGRVGREYGRSEGEPRRGETVELTSGTGRKVTGKLHEVRRTANGDWEGSVHIRGNEHFAGKVTRNLTREEKERQVRRGVAQRGLVTANAELQKLGRQEARVLLDQEQDPEVLANMTDGNHPAVVKYSKMLTEIDKKKKALMERVHKYRKELEDL